METMWVTYYVFGFLFFSLLSWLVWRWNEIWYVYPVQARCSTHVNLPPGYMGLPFVGEYLTYLWYFKILCRPNDFINSKRRKYKDDKGVYRSHLHGCPSIIVCSASLCKLVLHSTNSFKHEWPTTHAIGANSLISMGAGAQQGTIKAFIMGAINRPNSLARISLQVQPIIAAALESWSQPGKFVAKTHIRKVAFQLVSSYYPNLDLGERNIDTFLDCLHGTLQGLRAQPWKIPGMAYYHALKHRKKGTKMLREALDKRKQNVKETSKEESFDVMDLLMRMKNKEGRCLRDEAVIDNVYNTLEAGCIGMTYMLTWAFYLLAKSPHVLQKLREENMAINTHKSVGLITHEDVLKLTYTNKVVEEIIRSANLIPFVFWKATNDIEHEGYIIPKGWQVILWIRSLHVDPTNFEDPMNFNPDRWDTRPRYGTYFPFGGGPRSCPGTTYTRTTLAIFLHYLSIGYKWELLNPDTSIRYLPFPEPEGLEVSLRNI